MNEENRKLIEKFFRIVILLNRFKHHKRSVQEHSGDAHRGQGRVLSLLKLQPEISQKELSYLLDIRNQSLGELLMKLERNEFITRTPSEQDRRVLNVKLTEAGLEAANQIQEQQQNNNKVFECLSDEEQTELSMYLDRLVDELEQRMGDTMESDPRFGEYFGDREHSRPPHKHEGRGHGRTSHLMENDLPFGRGRGQSAFSDRRDSRTDRADQ